MPNGEQQFAVTYTGGSGYSMASWDVAVSAANPVHKTDNPEMAAWLAANGPFEMQDHTANRLEDIDTAANPQPTLESLEDIDGVGSERADDLRAAGFDSLDALRAASAEELAAVDGVSESLASDIMTQLTNQEG